MSAVAMFCPICGEARSSNDCGAEKALEASNGEVTGMDVIDGIMVPWSNGGQSSLCCELGVAPG